MFDEALGRLAPGPVVLLVLGAVGLGVGLLALRGVRLAVTGVRLRQWWADLLSRFWLRPAVMALAAAGLALALVRLEGRPQMPAFLSAWLYAGGVGGARDVLGVVAAASIGVAGTTFSITVAALSLASNQMGPRLLRNFTSDAGNQYALGTFVATFVYACVVLRSVHERDGGGDGGGFVPQLAVSGALLLAGACVAVLVWFLHHVAASINVDRIVALVQQDLVRALRRLPRREADGEAEHGGAAGSVAASSPHRCEAGAPLVAPFGGYLRVLDDGALADWAAEHDAVIALSVRPGGFIFPGSVIGDVRPARLAEPAAAALADALSVGVARSVEQDLEYSVRQLVEVGLRALSSGVNDPYTAITVLDHLGAALCEIAGRRLPDGCTGRAGIVRLRRPATDYGGLVDAMFHMLRQAGVGQPAMMIRLLEVLGVVAAVETDPARRRVLRVHADLAYGAARAATTDPSALAALADRHAAVQACLLVQGRRGRAGGEPAGLDGRCDARGGVRA